MDQKEQKKCKAWPRCGCIQQGYKNESEKNECGKKPRIKKSKVKK